MARSAFAKPAPLTPRQRSKGLVLPLSEKEAQLVRAMLGCTNDAETKKRITAYREATKALDAGQAQTLTLFTRIHRACERRGLVR